jgi:hypothetical protein
VTLVLDDARHQRCRVVRWLARESRIELLILLPNLNLIERL